MNIWSISQYATPGKYAYGTGHHFLAEQHVRHGHEVTIFSSAFNHYMRRGPVHRHLVRTEMLDGVRYVWLKGRPYRNTHGMGRVINWLLFVFAFFLVNKGAYGRPDIVILSSHSMLPVVCALWAKYRYGARLIVEIRDIWPLTLIELSGASERHPLIRLIGACERLAYSRADWIVSTLPNLPEHVAAVLGHRNFFFTYIPQGVPVELFRSGGRLDHTFVAEHFENNVFKVGYAGALGPSNALDTLVDVIMRLNETHPEIRFYLLGDGVDRERLIERCAGCSNVVFIPQIDRSLVPDFIAHCDLMYDSTRKLLIYEYGLSRQKWMDCLFAAKPITVSFSGFRSILDEAGCGSFIESEDPDALAEEILEYASRPREELRRMGAAGKRYVEQHHTYERLARDYEEIFVHILQD
jgi:glycosyltransferase involved in cell wall biosynthesis